MLGQDAGTNVKKLRAAAARVDFDAANVSCSGLTPAFLHDKLVTVRLDATEAGDDSHQRIPVAAPSSLR